MNREELKKHMIGFYKWMRENDTEEKAEEYFHYTDEDMAEEYIKRELEKGDINFMYKWIREKSGK